MIALRLVAITCVACAGSAWAQGAEFDFARDIGTILTRKGCNGTNCHGGVKGRGGFKLSSGALHPKQDYEWIVNGGTYQVLTAEVKGERTPRVNVREPEKSLVLQKATGAVTHGGGQRFASDSLEYRTLLAWIKSGAPFGREPRQESRIVRLEVTPRTVALEKGETKELAVTAHAADGRSDDITSRALFVSNDGRIAAVGEDGIVRAKKLGETAVLIRAAGLATSATIGVIGPPDPVTLCVLSLCC